MDTLPDFLLERYRVLEELGRGAFGVVHRVEVLATGEDAALKWIPGAQGSGREARELQLTRELDHPNLIRCFDGGLTEHGAFLVMELAQGNLAEQLSGGCQLGSAWRLAVDAGRGLIGLHRAGVVHRDLKPENLLVVGGRGKLSDLGIARATDLATLTAEGILLGTPAYMSPEQARGERVTPASDVYSLGMILFLLLEGKLPHDQRLSPVELLVAVAKAPRHRLGRGRDRAAPEVVAAVEQALEPEPGERPGDLEAWLRRLEVPGEPLPGSRGATTMVSAEAPPGEQVEDSRLAGAAPGGGTRPVARHRLRPALLVTALALLGLGLLAYGRGQPAAPAPRGQVEERPPPPPPPLEAAHRKLVEKALSLEDFQVLDGERLELAAVARWPEPALARVQSFEFRLAVQDCLDALLEWCQLARLRPPAQVDPVADYELVFWVMMSTLNPAQRVADRLAVPDVAREAMRGNNIFAGLRSEDLQEGEVIRAAVRRSLDDFLEAVRDGEGPLPIGLQMPLAILDCSLPDRPLPPEIDQLLELAAEPDLEPRLRTRLAKTLMDLTGTLQGRQDLEMSQLAARLFETAWELHLREPIHHEPLRWGALQSMAHHQVGLTKRWPEHFPDASARLVEIFREMRPPDRPGVAKALVSRYRNDNLILEANPTLRALVNQLEALDLDAL